MNICLTESTVYARKNCKVATKPNDKNRVGLSECVTDIGILLQKPECVGIPESPYCYSFLILIEVRITRQIV